MVTTCPNIAVDERFNLTETARILGISRSSLYRYITDGNIKFGIRKINGSKFVTGGEIIRIWKSQY